MRPNPVSAQGGTVEMMGLADNRGLRRLEPIHPVRSGIAGFSA